MLSLVPRRHWRHRLADAGQRLRFVVWRQRWSALSFQIKFSDGVLAIAVVGLLVIAS